MKYSLKGFHKGCRNCPCREYCPIKTKNHYDFQLVKNECDFNSLYDIRYFIRRIVGNDIYMYERYYRTLFVIEDK